MEIDNDNNNTPEETPTPEPTMETDNDGDNTTEESSTLEPTMEADDDSENTAEETTTSESTIEIAVDDNYDTEESPTPESSMETDNDGDNTTEESSTLEPTMEADDDSENTTEETTTPESTIELAVDDNYNTEESPAPESSMETDDNNNTTEENSIPESTMAIDNKKNSTTEDTTPSKPTKKKKSIIKRVIVWFIWIIFISIVTVVFTFLYLIYNGSIGYMPPIEDIMNPNDKYASIIYSADGVEMGRYYLGSGNREYSELDEVPEHMIQALVATEDVRFYEHSGIDARALARAVVKTGIMGQENAGGASTITQQLAKLLYTEKPAEDKLERMLQKPVEWMIALKLERHYSKNEIIKMYLNRFDFLYNAVGVKSAAYVYFGKRPSELTVEEAATLVGMVKNPAYYNPIRYNERTRERRNVVLNQMMRAGYLSEAEAEAYKAKPLEINFNPPQKHDEGIAPYFREELRRYLSAKKPVRSNYMSWDTKQFISDSVAWANDPLFGWCEKNGYDLYRDGLRIHTTLDSRMQQYAEEAAIEEMKLHQKAFDKTHNYKKSKYALYDKHGGEIDNEDIDRFINTSIRHSDRYRMGKKAGKTHEEILEEFNTPVEMTVFCYDNIDRDTTVTMTPYDSVLYRKQFLRTGFMAMDATNGHIKAYVGGIDYRFFKYDMVSTGRRQVGSTAKPYLYAAAIEELDLDPDDEIDTYSPVWFPKGSVEGTMPLKTALTKSHNGASAGLIYKITPARMINQMGWQGLTKENINPDQTIALGSCEIPLKEMCVGYSAFANKGYSSAAMMVTKITDQSGNIIASFTPRQSHALSKNGYARMLEALRSVVTNGTGWRISSLGAEMGGKTGTTDFNADGWFIGFTPNLVFGAWVGGEERYIHLNKVGGSTALPICKSFMEKVYKDDTLPYKKDAKFPEFEDAIIYKNVMFDELSDSLATTVDGIFD